MKDLLLLGSYSSCNGAKGFNVACKESRFMLVILFLVMVQWLLYLVVGSGFCHFVDCLFVCLFVCFFFFSLISPLIV
uniref:Uncharacterized protein n=1 Tax=Physcomitrium patens TaxID=3218 RepID=A0A2K1KEM9_PHYPA|nr:hypothetical protein PHYPA_008604 [Physcomitrium patens]